MRRSSARVATRSSCRSPRVMASSEASGSSSSSTGLPESSVRANATRWRIPPDSWEGRCPANSPTPSRSSIAPACSRASARPVPASRSDSAALSSARFQGSSRSRCGIQAQASSRASASRSPPTAIVPAVGSDSPAISSSRVDFPQPEAPTRATVSPGSTVRVRPRSASSSPKVRPTPATSIEGVAADRASEAGGSSFSRIVAITASLRAHYRTGSEGQRRAGDPEALSQPAFPRAPLWSPGV